MAGILEHLKWESLKKRRRDSRLILLHKGLKGKASIPTGDLIPLLGAAGIIILWHVGSPMLILVFVRVAPPPPPHRPLGIRINALPDYLISSAEGAEDGVAKFTFLVRAIGTSHPNHGPGE